VLSGLHGGKVDKNSKSVVKEVVDSAIQLHKSQIEEKSLNILVQVEVGMLVKIPAEYLNLIVNNLISNSVKHSKSNGNLVIKAEQKDGKTELTVQDFGDGISEADLPHIFERFFTTTKEGKNLKRKGHGIGLAIVKSICDEFGVSYRAESEKGKGTSIILGFC
jgi:signal transduction histidine kinase